MPRGMWMLQGPSIWSNTSCRGKQCRIHSGYDVCCFERVQVLSCKKVALIILLSYLEVLVLGVLSWARAKSWCVNQTAQRPHRFPNAWPQLESSQPDPTNHSLQLLLTFLAASKSTSLELPATLMTMESCAWEFRLKLWSQQIISW